jgi:hypothetical protein
LIQIKPTTAPDPIKRPGLFSNLPIFAFASVPFSGPASVQGQTRKYRLFNTMSAVNGHSLGADRHVSKVPMPEAPFPAFFRINEKLDVPIKCSDAVHSEQTG